MSTNIPIRIRKRKAELTANAYIVNGNSDYTVTFDFDSEWSEYPDKTARFNFWKNGDRDHIDVAFTGNVCSVPMLREIFEVEIGVYAGSIRTTTGARVLCETCITDIPAEQHVPKRDYFNELMDQLNQALAKRNGKTSLKQTNIVGGEIIGTAYFVPFEKHDR